MSLPQTVIGTKISECIERQSLIDILNGLLNCSIGVPALAEGTNAATIKTTGNITFRINGRPYAYSATDNVAITAGAIQAVSTYCKYLVSIVAGGTITVTPGNQAASAALALLPDMPASSAPIGYMQIATDATHTYTPGTTDNSAAGITATYVDLNTMVTSA